MVDPFGRTVEVYAPGQPGLVLDETGTLTLETVLPGFALPVQDIFPAGPAASCGPLASSTPRPPAVRPPAALPA